MDIQHHAGEFDSKFESSVVQIVLFQGDLRIRRHGPEYPGQFSISVHRE